MRRTVASFLIRPDGETIVASETIDHFPNGMALSLDGRELYIILSNMPGIVRAPIQADGTLGEALLVVEMPGTVPDGLALDAEGNIYIACYAPNKVFRYTVSGELELVAEDWQSVVLSAPTNIAFGGPGYEIRHLRQFGALAFVDDRNAGCRCPLALSGLELGNGHSRPAAAKRVHRAQTK